MKKVTTHYSETEVLGGKGEDIKYRTLDIKVTEGLAGKGLIKFKPDRSWKTKKDTIAYLKWCIEEVEGLDV